MFKLKFSIVILVAGVVMADYPTPFETFYHLGWGHANLINELEVQLVLDQHSGGGFYSNMNYRTGNFHMQIKLSPNRSHGEIASFFLSDDRVNAAHFELDIEFFVINDTYILQTNIFNNDPGHREQAFHLWFDPTTSFHDYEILWNQHLILFSVDGIPIRVFKNNTQSGLNYPAGAMHIEASIWNATWAGDIDFTKGPFTANYRYFALDACSDNFSPIVCNLQDLYWNQIQALSPSQQTQLDNTRAQYMYFDYCANNPAIECHLP